MAYGLVTVCTSTLHTDEITNANVDSKIFLLDNLQYKP